MSFGWPGPDDNKVRRTVTIHGIVRSLVACVLVIGIVFVVIRVCADKPTMVTTQEVTVPSAIRAEPKRIKFYDQNTDRYGTMVLEIVMPNGCKLYHVELKDPYQTSKLAVCPRGEARIDNTLTVKE
jgi:hypothetical protein